MAGNISYDPSGTFTLNARDGQSAEQTFFRAETRPGEAPWTVTERTPEGWALAKLACTHPGASVVTSSRATGRADITLANADTVTCTYTNTLRPTAGVLLLRKITTGPEGAVGRFPFAVDGSGFHATRDITTKTPGVAAFARPIKIKSGTYQVTEGAAGKRFKLSNIVCNGRQTDGEVKVDAARGAVCTFTNRQRQIGRIGVKQVTQGALGTSGYVITPAQLRGGRLRQGTRRDGKSSTTRAQNTAREATGDTTLAIPFAGYVIQQTQTTSATPGRVRNFAAVGSASRDLRLRDNLAVAAAVAVGQGGSGACSASAPPRARAAC